MIRKTNRYLSGRARIGHWYWVAIPSVRYLTDTESVDWLFLIAKWSVLTDTSLCLLEKDSCWGNTLLRIISSCEQNAFWCGPGVFVRESSTLSRQIMSLFYTEQTLNSLQTLLILYMGK